MNGSAQAAWAGLGIRAVDGVCGSIYSNFLPFVTPEALTMYNDFERVLYASL
jgi:methyl acetate hydrolase